MNTTNTWLQMAKRWYEADAARWSLTHRDPVVGSYDAHNAWQDYEDYLFKGVDTQDKAALEYGCGPGRNLIRYRNIFARIDGVDIAQTNLDKAHINLSHHNISNANLMLCDGQSIPAADQTYDVVFSVICLQHIPCHTIRYAIMSEAHRVLKDGGSFCFQMGYGGRRCGRRTAEYYDNAYDATSTNSGHDVTVRYTENLEDDLIRKIGFKSFDFDLRPTGPGDTHAQWIWVRAGK